MEPTLHSSLILLVTDRPDLSRDLAREAERVAGCQILAVAEPWCLAAPVLAIIADVSPERPRTQSCLTWLAQQFGTQRPPAIFLSGQIDGAVIREATAWGATACLPAYSEPRTVLAAVVRLIDPDASVTNLIVRRGADRTARLFKNMFQAAETGSVDLAVVEDAISPVLNVIQEGGLTRWLDVIWEHDDATFQHCLLVAGLVCAFAQRLGLSRADQVTMARAALVHDVGKARIPPAILNKPSKLDAAEMAVMRTHAALGYDLLTASGGCDPVALAVTRHHHEMLDGSGYPDGLKGAAITDPIRLLTVCDIYAALIERRPYKAPFPAPDAMRILQAMTGKLDGALVEAFGRALASESVQ